MLISEASLADGALHAARSSRGRSRNNRIPKYWTSPSYAILACSPSMCRTERTANSKDGGRTLTVFAVVVCLTSMSPASSGRTGRS